MDRALYDEHARLEQDHWWFVARRAILRDVIAAQLDADGTHQVLDVGAGTGGMFPMLTEFGRVLGIEGDAEAVGHSRSTYEGYEVRLGEIPGAVPSDGSFDLVTAFDVIEHIADDLEAMRSLREAVRPGGLVVVTVPALGWLWSDHDVANGHVRRYHGRGLETLIRSAGLELQLRSYFNTFLLPVVAVARLTQRFRHTAVQPDSDFSMPAAPVNRLLTRIMTAERRLVVRHGLPLGVSLVAVASRPT